MSEIPTDLPIRCRGNQWEVLIVDRNSWLTCDNEQDARILSRAPVLMYESPDEETRKGSSLAEELEQTTRTLQKYELADCRLYRSLLRRSKEVRRAAEGRE